MSVAPFYGSRRNNYCRRLLTSFPCAEREAEAEALLAALGGSSTRILAFGGATIPTGLPRPLFGGAFGSGMTMRVSHEGQIMRRPLQLPAARMFWPHLGQSN
jgi:hypothetical protein